MGRGEPYVPPFSLRVPLSLRMPLVLWLVGGCLLGGPGVLWAEQRITVRDDSPIPVTAASNGVTLFKFPQPVNTAFSSLEQFGFEIQGYHVVVSKVKEKGDLVVLLKDGVTAYTFQMSPADVSAETVVVEDVRHRQNLRPQDDPLVKRVSPFVGQLVELTRIFGGGHVPKGYRGRTEEEARKLVPSWVGLSVEQVWVFDGPAYTVLRFGLRNTSGQEHTLQNWEWNGERVLGVALNRDTLLPGQVAEVVVIRTVSPPPGRSPSQSPGQSPGRLEDAAPDGT